MESRAAIWIDFAPAGDLELASNDLFEWGAMGLEELDDGALKAWLPLDWDRGLIPSDWKILAEGEVEAKDWDLSWRLQQEPLRVTDRLVVVPPWVDKPADAEICLRMEAKQAFGTGGHESTRLASRLLEGLPLAGKSVFDIGAGTGILGFYCRILGAGHIELCDIDPDSIPCLEENAELNGISGDWNAWAGSIDKLATGTKFDILLANMLRTEFFPMRAQALALMPVGGLLILSGYLVKERELVMEWFSKDGLELVSEGTENDWWAGCGRRIK
jgi:ribosomal protein L11 methyltransferase